MTKSLVTGGAGFIGSNLVDQLIEIGHKVIVIDNEYSDAHEQFYYNEKAEYHKLDIRDDATRSLYDGVDYVFHIAAEARIGPSIENPTETVSINSFGTCTVLQFAREAGVKRVIYSSTSSAYGLQEPPHVEALPDDCLNPYSVSKVNGEKLCKMYTDLFGLETVIFRYFNVYGNRQPIKGQYAPVIGIFLRQLENDQELTIVGDGEQRRDFVNVLDICRANIMAAISNPDDDAYGQVYNVGTGINYSVNQIAEMFNTETKYIPARKGEARISLANIEKIYNTFAWRPQVNLEEWIGNKLDG